MIKYYSTNNKNYLISFKEAILSGLAPDKGLYMPERFPVYEQNKLLAENFSELTTYLAKLMIEDEIKETLKNNFPYVSDIKTNFNFVLSKLNINIETEKAIAYLTPINKYLLESGRFSEKSENDDFITIECNECIIDKKNLKIINKFRETKEFPLPDCKIIIEKQTFNLVCGNIVIEWGDEKYFENKLEKLKYVIEDARNKFGDYFKIDLKFFSNGKIIVSKIKANESK